MLRQDGSSQTHLALVASARAAHRNAFPHDNVQDPLEQAGILRLVKDPLHDIKAMGRERNAEGLRSGSCQQRPEDERTAAGQAHLLVLAIPLTPLKHPLNNRLQPCVDISRGARRVDKSC